MKKKLSCKVKNGGLPDIKNQVAEILRKLEGEWIDLTIQWGEKRSTPQNRMYWGIIIPQFQHGFKSEWGEDLDKDTVHEILKDNSMTIKSKIEKDGKIITFNQSTADLDTIEFSNYVTELDHLCLEYFGFNLTLPDDL